MKTKKTAREKAMEIQNIIAHSCMGAGGYIRHMLSGIIYTDNVQAVAEAGDAFWLIDAICSYRRKEVFQVWELEVLKDKSAVLTMKEDTNCPILVRQEIDRTDFPLDNIKFYIELGSVDLVNHDYVLMIPNER
jgi:hypothetical protein